MTTSDSFRLTRKSALDYVRLHQTVSDYIRLYQTPDYIRLDQTTSYRIRLNQTVSDYIRLYQTTSDLGKGPASSLDNAPLLSLTKLD